MRPITAAILLACTLPTLARAEDPQMCRNGSITTQEPLGLAKAVGSPRTYLRSDLGSCPAETAECRGKTYVVPGDTLITGATNGRYVCALYPGRNGGSAGFVLPEEIASQPAPANLPASAWTGQWHDGDDTITLRAKGSQLVASGDAYWPSANPSQKERPYGPNLGDMSGTATPQGNRVVFAGKDPDDCRVTLTLLPPFLAVADNLNCGGANVSFTGVYQRR